jgi:hypothetical protein
MLDGQDAVTCPVPHMVFGPRVYVIHVNLIAGQGRRRPDELPAVVEYERVYLSSASGTTPDVPLSSSIADTYAREDHTGILLPPRLQ